MPALPAFPASQYHIFFGIFQDRKVRLLIGPTLPSKECIWLNRYSLCGLGVLFCSDLLNVSSYHLLRHFKLSVFEQLNQFFILSGLSVKMPSTPILNNSSAFFGELTVQTKTLNPLSLINLTLFSFTIFTEQLIATALSSSAISVHESSHL